MITNEYQISIHHHSSYGILPESRKRRTPGRGTCRVPELSEGYAATERNDGEPSHRVAPRSSEARARRADALIPETTSMQPTMCTKCAEAAYARFPVLFGKCSPKKINTCRTYERACLANLREAK